MLVSRLLGIFLLLASLLSSGALAQENTRQIAVEADGAAVTGKRVLLYVEQDVRRPDGTRGPAVRIRAKRVDQAPAAREPGAEG